MLSQNVLTMFNKGELTVEWDTSVVSQQKGYWSSSKYSENSLLYVFMPHH
jgi:hypothetical protein